MQLALGHRSGIPGSATYQQSSAQVIIPSAEQLMQSVSLIESLGVLTLNFFARSFKIKVIPTVSVKDLVPREMSFKNC
jgi:hypothetical protein